MTVHLDMDKGLASAMQKILKPAARQSIYVPIDLYAENMRGIAERLHQLDQKMSKDSIRQIAEAAYQKQEQRLNSLRDECVRLLSLMRDKGLLTQDEINKAARNG